MLSPIVLNSTLFSGHLAQLHKRIANISDMVQDSTMVE